MKRSRALLALLPVALVGSMLTSCVSAGQTEGGGPIAGVECAVEGSVSKSIEIDGEFGASDIALKTAAPITAEALERTALIKGDGDALKENDSVESQYTIFSGATGEVIGSESGTFELNPELVFPWVLEALGCSSFGDRIAAVAPVLDIFDESTATGLGIATDDTLVIVFDLLQGCEATLPRDETYPEVDLGDGSTEPKISIPACMEAPTELEIEVLVEGDGPVVESNQNIMTNYVGVKWDGAKRFDGNWSETGIQFSTQPGALIQGFTEAMVGQKVGSTILVTIPPELGYGGTPGHQLEHDTLTFVLQMVSVAE